MSSKSPRILKIFKNHVFLIPIIGSFCLIQIFFIQLEEKRKLLSDVLTDNSENRARISDAKGLVAFAPELRSYDTFAINYSGIMSGANRRHCLPAGQREREKRGKGRNTACRLPFFSSARIFSSGECRDTHRPDTRRRNAIPRGNLRFYRKFIRGAGPACEPDAEIG